MPQNISQHVLNISSDACEYIKKTSTFVDHTYHMTARTQNISQNHLDSEEKRCKPSKPIHCLSRTKPHSLFANIYDFSKIVLNKHHQCQREHKYMLRHLLTKTIPCRRWHKRHLNLFWLNTSHASEDIKCPMPSKTCISTCVEQNPIPCQRKHSIFLKFCWINTTNASENTKFMLRHLLTKTIPCQRWHKRYLNLFWLNTLHASKDIKCPMPSKTSR